VLRQQVRTELHDVGPARADYETGFIQGFVNIGQPTAYRSHDDVVILACRETVVGIGIPDTRFGDRPCHTDTIALYLKESGSLYPHRQSPRGLPPRSIQTRTDSKQPGSLSPVRRHAATKLNARDDVSRFVHRQP
jgi:hypothetical protein